MAADELIADFKVSQTRLLERAREMQILAELYQTTLTGYGFSAADTTAFDAAITDAMELPTNETLVQEIAELNQDADAADNELRKQIGFIIGRAKMKWNPESHEVKQFRAGNISQERRFELQHIAVLVIEKATERLAELADKGLTMDIIDDLQTAVDAQKAILKSIRLKEEARPVATKNRIAALNALKQTMVEISLAGKAAFEYSDATAYKAFLLDLDNDLPQTPPDAPIIVSIENDIMTIAADDTATSNQYQYSDDNSNWSASITFTGSTVAVDSPPGVTRYYRARTWNNGGVSPFSSVFTLALMLAAVPELLFSGGTFTWVLIAGALGYRMRYRAAGSSDAFTDVFEDNVDHYNWTPPSGEWEFQIQAFNGAVVSPWASFVITIP